MSLETTDSDCYKHLLTNLICEDNQGSDTRRGIGIMLLNTIGQCGPLLGTNVFNTGKPRYVKGQSICAAFIFFNGFLAFGLRTLLVWENKKLDARQEMDANDTQPGGSEVKESAVGEENSGSKAFRYIL